MTGVEKTATIKREMIPVDRLVKNERNPNKMSQRQFDLLVDNLERTGITEAIVVRPAVGIDDYGQYRIVSGHHRFDAAVYLGFKEVPCAIITDPSFDEEQETFQLIRMNVIKGQLDPQAFFNLAQEYMAKYPADVLQELMGFADEAVFQRLVKQTADSLPDTMKDQFKEAAKEIKTIDGLAALLQKMFSTYGDTLPYGYMVIDYGGQKSIWLRASSQMYKQALAVGSVCVEHTVSMDDVFERLFVRLTKGDLVETLKTIASECPKIELAPGMTGPPTKEELAKWSEL